MTQPFWEVELAQQQGRLINAAMDYSAQSRTAPVIAMQPLTPSPMAWQSPPMSRPAQTYAPASRSAPIVFSPPPVPQSTRMHRKQTGTMRPPAARTASSPDDGDACDEVLLDLGARLKSLKHPPGWLAGVLVAVAGYIGNQLRHPEAPPVQASATTHSGVPAQAKHAKAK